MPGNLAELPADRLGVGSFGVSGLEGAAEVLEGLGGELAERVGAVAVDEVAVAEPAAPELDAYGGLGVAPARERLGPVVAPQQGAKVAQAGLALDAGT